MGLAQSKPSSYHPEKFSIFFCHLYKYQIQEPFSPSRLSSSPFDIPIRQVTIGTLFATPYHCIIQTSERLWGGIITKDLHVRVSCLNAIKRIPISAIRSQPQNLQVVTSLWIGLHDPESFLVHQIPAGHTSKSSLVLSSKSTAIPVFVIFSVLVPLLFEILALGYLKDFLDKLTPGPYNLIFASFVPFFFDIPITSRFRVLTVHLTNKLFIYLAGLQLLLSSGKQSLVPGLCGILAGCFYCFNTFGILWVD